MTTEEKIKQIDSEEYYSASKIITNQWLWMKTVLTLTAFLRSDEGKRLLSPLIIKRGAVNRYKIKGSKIIELMREVEKGNVKINYSE